MDNSYNNRLVWKKKSFMQCSSLYAKLITLMVSDMEFTKNAADSIDPTDSDAFAQVIVNIFNETGQTLSLIRSLLEQEFSKIKETSKGSVMRGNNIISKIEGAYVRTIGTEYVKELFRALIDDLSKSKDSLEVDPRKLNIFRFEEEDTEEVLNRNRQDLTNWANLFLNRILDTSLLHMLPKEIRAIAAYTSNYAQQYIPDSVCPLIGGFLMLRYLVPAIVTPESWGIMGDCIPSAETRRKLVLIAKLLQNTSNGVEFSSKEDYMSPMNSFIQHNKNRFQSYLMEVANSSFAISDTQFDQSIDIRQFDIVDIFELHRIIDSCTYKLIPLLKNRRSQQQSAWRSAKVSRLYTPEEIIQLLLDIGCPPKKTKRERKTRNEQEDADDTTSINNSDGSIGLMDTANLDRARFLYQGPPNKDGHAVFYLIVSRVKMEYLENANQLIQYIFKVMDSTVNSGPYAIVIDMSWSQVTMEMKNNISRQLSSVSHIFSREYKKNLSAVYIVHPSAYTRAVLYFMRGFTSRKLSRKVFEIYNWKELQQHIQSDNILLPEISRDYITKTYQVTKVNAKGKHQERLIKFTLNSLLNMNPKSRKIQNEKFLHDIDEISSAQDSLELLMTFTPNSDSELTSKKRSGLLSSGSSKEDLLFRRYICKTIEDRDSIIEDIFRAGFNSELISLPQEYRVTKVNKKGKHQDRLFKLTCDSLLNLSDNTKINTEISFAGIENVTLDKDHSEIVWMKYKSEDVSRKVICKEYSKELVTVLTDCLSRYKRDEDSQETNERRELDDNSADDAIYFDDPSGLSRTFSGGSLRHKSNPYLVRIERKPSRAFLGNRKI